MKETTKKIMIGITMFVFSVSLYGCGTVKGVGEDIKTVGGWISGSSDHVKESVKKNPPGSGMEE